MIKDQGEGRAVLEALLSGSPLHLTFLDALWLLSSSGQSPVVTHKTMRR